MKLNLEMLNSKQKNIFGFIVYCISILFIVLFAFLSINYALVSHSIGMEFFPYTYLAIAGFYLANDFLMHKVYGFEIPRDYFYKLGLAQRYVMPLVIVFIFLTFQTGLGRILFD